MEYTFIEKLPFIGEKITSGGSGTLLFQYLGAMYAIILTTSAILAFFMLVVGGVQYTYTALSPSAKGAAKERMKNALLGLLIVLGAWLILNTINPDLVRLDLSIKKIDNTGGYLGSYTGVPDGAGGDTTVNPVDPGNITGTPGLNTGTHTSSGPWTSTAEESVRKQVEAGGRIKVVKGSCGGVDYNKVENGCTDMANLGSGAINGIRSVAENCTDCGVIYITGGTECCHSDGSAHHTTKNSLDLRRSPELDSYLLRAGTDSTCTVHGRKEHAEIINGAKYCQENAAHWHVTYP